LGPVFELVVVAEIDLAQPARLSAAAAKIAKAHQRQRWRAAVGAAGLVDEAVRQLDDRRTRLQVPDFEPRPPLRGACGGRRRSGKEGDRKAYNTKACNTTTRHGEIIRETPQNHSNIVHRRRNILAALLLAPTLAFAQGESEFLAGAAKSCPGCALERAALK